MGSWSEMTTRWRTPRGLFHQLTGAGWSEFTRRPKAQV